MARSLFRAIFQVFSTIAGVVYAARKSRKMTSSGADYLQKGVGLVAKPVGLTRHLVRLLEDLIRRTPRFQSLAGRA